MFEPWACMAQLGEKALSIFTIAQSRTLLCTNIIPREALVRMRMHSANCERQIRNWRFAAKLFEVRSHDASRVQRDDLWVIQALTEGMDMYGTFARCMNRYDSGAQHAMCAYSRENPIDPIAHFAPCPKSAKVARALPPSILSFCLQGCQRIHRHKPGIFRSSCLRRLLKQADLSIAVDVPAPTLAASVA